jgi:hypothetical protein
MTLQRRHTLALVALALALAVAIACSGGHGPPPEAPVEPVPRELAGLRVHVVNATSDEAQRAGENAAGYTMQLRADVQRALARAGYVVVVERDRPHDVAVEVTAHWHVVGLETRGVASIELALPDGARITQLSAAIDTTSGAYIDARSVARLVNALGASDALREDVRRRRAPARIATPPAPPAPVGEALTTP